MNFEIVMRLIGRWAGTVKFFPSDEYARIGIAEQICEMASDEDQVRWLVNRVPKLYTEWPAMHEVRAVFCSKFKPRDGSEVYSEIFLEGIPSETESQLALPSAPLRQLEPGEPVSADAEMVALAATVATPAKRLPFVAVDTSVRRDESDYAALKRSIADFSERAIPTKVRSASEAEIEHLKALQDANRKESLPANEPITESDLVGVEQLKP